MIALRNFPAYELRCKGSGLIILAPGFGEDLQDLRTKFGKPMDPSSVCRSKAHNEAVGGHPRSLHVCDFPHHPTGGTCCIDVRAHERHMKAYRQELMDLALDLGWSVGVHPAFLHLDMRTRYAGLPQARFTY